MKESTGELSMTVITIVAIVAIGGFVATTLWPNVRNWINNQWGAMTTPKSDKSTTTTGYIETIEGNYNIYL